MRQDKETVLLNLRRELPNIVNTLNPKLSIRRRKRSVKVTDVYQRRPPLWSNVWWCGKKEEHKPLTVFPVLRTRPPVVSSDCVE